MLTAVRDYMQELLALRRANFGTPENTSDVVKKLWALYDKFEDAEHVVCGNAAKLLQSATENKPLTLRELRELAEADETVYEANGRQWDSRPLYPEGTRAKSENCDVVVDADKIAGGFFLYARKPEGRTQ